MKAITVATIAITIMLEMINKIKISFKITVMIIIIKKNGEQDSRIIVLSITRTKIAIIMIIMNLKMKKFIKTMKMYKDLY